MGIFTGDGSTIPLLKLHKMEWSFGQGNNRFHHNEEVALAIRNGRECKSPDFSREGIFNPILVRQNGINVLGD
jgi:hypothetical protein